MKRKNVAVMIAGLMFLSVMFLPVLVAPSAAEASTGGDYGIISVYGEAVITAQPDSARVVLAVETTDGQAEVAARENARLTNKVLAALKKAGFDEKQLKTSGYRLYGYEERPDPQNKENYITKYRAYNELSISLSDLNEVGNVIDIAIQAGANRVVSVFFELKDAEALRLQALQYATIQAKAKAEAIAQSAGVTIKGIKLIHEEMTGYSPYRVSVEDSLKEMSGAGATPIFPDDVEVMARVKAEYYF